MSSNRAFLTVVGDTERRLRAPASPEVVHARDVARRVLARAEHEAAKTSPRLQLAFVDPERMTAGEIESVANDLLAQLDRVLPAREGDVHRAGERLALLEREYASMFPAVPALDARLYQKICELRSEVHRLAWALRDEPSIDAVGLAACERFDVEAEVDALVSSHADIDALDVWRELPTRPPEDAPLLELISYLMRRWWRRTWRRVR